VAYCDWGVDNSDQYVETEHGKIYFGKSTGEVQSLLQHAFDLFCLQTVNRLPDFFIDRLKDTHEFHGVRYKVALAAIIARAGFDIEFLDDIHKSEAHCEFIATHREAGQNIGVEERFRIWTLNQKKPGKTILIKFTLTIKVNNHLCPTRSTLYILRILPSIILVTKAIQIHG